MTEQTASKLTSSAQTLLDRLSSLKREAYLHLDQALTFDSSTTTSTDTKLDTSIIMYERCLNYIDEALRFYVTNRGELSNHDDAIRVYNQLVSMKNQTNERLAALKDERVKLTMTKKVPNLDSQEEFLDIGDEILNDNECIIIDDIGNEEPLHATNAGKVDQVRSKLSNLQKATEILRVDNGAQIFYIADDGTVSTPSYPTTLSVYTFDDDASRTSNNVIGFIRVGSWMYPLVPSESPAMKTTFNAYIFPNSDKILSANSTSAAESQAPGCSFVGITFATGYDDSKAIFEDVLSNFDLLIYQNRDEAASKRPRVEQPSGASTLIDSGAELLPPSVEKHKPGVKQIEKEKIEKPSIEEEESSETTTTPKPATAEGWTADRVASGLVTSATYVSQGIATATEYGSKYLKVGADKIKSQIHPNTQQAEVDPKYHSLMKNVRYGTHVGVRVSSFVVNKLGELATFTARTVGPHIRSGSTTLLSKSGVMTEKSANGYIDGACKVAHGSLESYGILYDSLEKAARTLGKNVTENTVTVVEHKYGPSAAQVTKDGMYSVGNVAISVNNFRNVKIIRTVAKATAKEVIKPSVPKEKKTE